MPSNKQLRITVPRWIAELKGWKKNSNLQIIPVVKDESEGVTKDTVFIIKEVKNQNKKR